VKFFDFDKGFKGRSSGRKVQDPVLSFFQNSTRISWEISAFNIICIFCLLHFLVLSHLFRLVSFYPNFPAAVRVHILVPGEKNCRNTLHRCHPSWIKGNDRGWGRNLDVTCRNECSQLRQPTGSLMCITCRVHVFNHQAYARSLWRVRQLFVQICGVAAGQIKPLARGQESNSQRNSGNNLGAIKICMHGAFLHANRVGAVHTAHQALSNPRRAPMTSRWFWGSRSGKDRKKLVCSTLSWSASLIPRSKFKFEWPLKWKGGHYIECISAHLMQDWTSYRHLVQF